MMTKKKRRAITISIALIVILLILLVVGILYLKTDLFKSNQVLFAKYMGQNIENMQGYFENFTNSNISRELEGSKYVTNGQLEIKHTKNLGTTLENTDSYINNLKITIDCTSDKQSNYSYNNVKLYKADENIAGLEYLNENNLYGVRFSDLFKQFTLINNQDLKNLFQNLGYTDEELENIPNNIELNYENILNNIWFSSEELEVLKNKYITEISSNLEKAKFSKQTNQILNINNTQYKTNLYTLTLTKEELNNMYINILEKISQDEIILNKIAEINDYINVYNLISKQETVDLKKQFTEQINLLIENIRKNNIGGDETKIKVYEYKGKTLETIIETPNYKVDIETQDDNYLKATVEKEKKSTIVELKKENNKTDLTIKNSDESGQTDSTIFSNNFEISEKTINSNTSIRYETLNDKVEMNYKNEINKVDSFDNIITLDDKNSIIFNELEKDYLSNIINNIKQGIQNEKADLESKLSFEDVLDTFKVLGIVKEKTKIEANGITETERTRYNAQFELYKNQTLDEEKMKEFITAITNNIGGVEVSSNNQFKIKITTEEKDDNAIASLNQYMEENRNDVNYKVDIEYEEQTGLASYYVITLEEKE